MTTTLCHHSMYTTREIYYQIMHPSSQHYIRIPTSTLPNHSRYIWNTSKQDIAWDIFQATLVLPLTGWRNKWTPSLTHTIPFTQHDINTCWMEFRGIILDTAMEVVGKKRVSIHHKHWYTIDPNIPSLHRTYIRLLRKVYEHETQQHAYSCTSTTSQLQAQHAFRDAMKSSQGLNVGKNWYNKYHKDHHVIWTAWHRTIPSTQHPLPPFTSPIPAASPVDNLNTLAQHFASISTLPDDPAFNKSQDDNVRHTINHSHYHHNQFHCHSHNNNSLMHVMTSTQTLHSVRMICHHTFSSMGEPC